MPDILSAVNDFILEYVKTLDLPALEREQIIRGWPDFAEYPTDLQEYAILTLQGMTRHGTNVRLRRNAEGPTGIVETVSRLAEHMVRVDFCCVYPRQTEDTARIRADLLELLARDAAAVDFFRQYGLSSCYAEDVKPLPFSEEERQSVARYSVTLRLGGWTGADIPLDTFSKVSLHVENADVQYPIQE